MGEIGASANKAVADVVIEDKESNVTEKAVDLNDNIVEDSTHEHEVQDDLGFQGDDKEEYVKGHPVIRNGNFNRTHSIPTDR